jgi:N-acetylmuramoyl-L-alanine amidase
MHNVENAKIKDVILQGVLEENLKMSDPPAGNSSPVTASGSRLRTRILPVLLITVLIVMVYFIGGSMSRQPADPVVFSAGDPLLPWAEIIRTRGFVLPGTGETSVVMESNKGLGDSFDAQRLLNYDFLLNSGQVRLSSVFGLGVQTIVIDPGHGGRDPGAIGSQGTREKDIVLDIARRLRNKIMHDGQYRVLLTRETDTFISLRDRVKFSNQNKADLFISLHINALPQKQFNVTETFYFGPPSDEYTLRLAEQENRGSEILTGDFKDMIKKIGDVLKEQESATLAATLQHSLFSNLQKYDRVIADNGIKIAPFVVLLGVDAPSVLVEISCISKHEEETNLNNSAYREKITSSLKEGISDYLKQRQKEVAKGDDNGKKIRNKNS